MPCRRCAEVVERWALPQPGGQTPDSAALPDHLRLRIDAYGPRSGSVPPYEAITRGIKVQVESAFVPEHSNPQQRRWFFSYKIRVSNLGQETVQLINRFWIITDAEGQIEHVRGAGVIGEQPVLKPGQAFEYSSGCPLGTPFGSMHGTYEMVSEHGEHFEVQIPAFVLRLPGTMN